MDILIRWYPIDRVSTTLIVQVPLEFLESGEPLHRMVRTMPYPPMQRVLMLIPILASVVQSIRISALFVCANVGAQVTYEVSSVSRHLISVLSS